MALEGTLQDMSLGDLFQVFRMGPKTGVLLLTGDDARGLIYVAAGQLVDAALVHAAGRSVSAVQDEAVIQMLLWDDATFSFRHDPAVAQRPVRMRHDAEWLVLEGMKRRDDPSRALPYHRITLDTQLQLSPLPTSAESGVSLDVNQWRILSQVSSSPNLRTISEATGLPPERVMRIVAELLAIGLVEIVPPARPEPRPREQRAAVVALTTSEPFSPCVVGVPAGAAQGSGEARPQSLGRSLIDAVMRRVRGL
jgi:hypothetical protein